MKLKTRVFGEIDIDDEKIITFENGIIGFPDLKRFTLIFNEEKKGGISWMQSLDEPVVALPVMNPLAIKEDYNPMVEDELLKPLGEMTPEDTFVLVTVTVPEDIKKITVNLKAPIVIIVAERKAAQIIVEGGEVKYPIYEMIKSGMEKAGE